jgi:hypothetical protein
VTGNIATDIAGPAGWWHDYVCPTHGTELLDPVEGGHLCPHGCRVAGEPYDGAWRVLHHQEVARRLRTLGHRYQRHLDPHDRKASLDLLAACTSLYDAALERGWSDEARPWMLRGKLFQQALTEAIWGASVADAVSALVRGSQRAGAGVDDLHEAARLLEGLVDTMLSARRTLVVERGELRNNYTAWLNCAGRSAETALGLLGRPSDHERWLHGPEGLFRYLDAAVGDDGWEWEGATYYHLFVLRAALLSLRGAGPAWLPARTRRCLLRMLRVLVDLSSDGGLLPVLHDGPYERRPATQELLEVCVLGRQLAVVPGLADLERHARARLGPGDTELEDLLDGWFTGPPVPVPDDLGGRRRSTVWPDVGYASLRSPRGGWHAVLDAGPHGGSHGHRDKLALYLYGNRGAWQPAPGVPPYGSALREDYYASTVAHPTFRLDDLDQAECEGRIVTATMEAETRTVVATVSSAYPGVDAERHVQMHSGYLLDALRVQADSPRRIALALRPAAGLSHEQVGAATRTEWRDDGPDREPLIGLHACSEPASFAVVAGRGTSDDPARTVPVADWTATAGEAWFVSVFAPRRPGTPDLRRLGIEPSGADLCVTVETADGRHDHTLSSIFPPRQAEQRQETP